MQQEKQPWYSHTSPPPLSLAQDYTQGRRGLVHQTMMLAYGRVALQAPKELLFSTVETDIMMKVLYHYRKSCQARTFKGGQFPLPFRSDHP